MLSKIQNGMIFSFFISLFIIFLFLLSSLCLSMSSLLEPKSFKHAIQDPKWCDAMTIEIYAIEVNKTWSLIELPIEKNVISCKWVYKIEV